MIRCLHCGLHVLARHFEGDEAYACPRCGMDESGLDLSGLTPVPGMRHDPYEDGPATSFDVHPLRER